MDKWLLLPVTDKLLDVTILFFFVGFILVALGLFIKWLKPIITKKDFSLEFNSEKEEEEKVEKGISLSQCIEDTPPFRNELMYVISKSIRFGYDLAQLKEVTTIRNQMNSAGVYVSLITNIFLKYYQEKIDEARSHGKVIDESSLRIFQEYMHRLVKINFLEELKKSFKENGLLTYSDDTYEDIYCRDRIKKLISEFQTNINTFFPSTLTPSSVEIISILEENEKLISMHLKQCFMEAREIAKQSYEEEERRKVIFDTELLSIAGVERASRSGK